MSKTLGTGVDPTALVRTWGVDAVRYWLLHEVPAAGDADYTEAGFARAYAADLANGLGNLLQRTVNMLHRYRGGVVPPRGEPEGASRLRAAARELRADLRRALADEWNPRQALDAVFAVVRGANRAIEDTRPWALARTEREGNGAAGRQLDTVLYELLECLRLVGEALRPFLPDTAARIAGQLGVAPAEQWTTAFDWGGLDPGTQIGVPVPLFPRRDLGAGVP